MSADPQTRLRYGGVFVIALSTLVLEILLARITSVTAWYHLSFFVISLAMLGMTAGAVVVFVARDHFRDEVVPQRLAGFSLAYALTTPLMLALALSIPLFPVDSLMDFLALFAYGGALAVPFGLAGVALTLALTRANLPEGRVYAIDLIGAATGCVLVIPLLNWLDAPSAALIAAALGALAALAFSRSAGRSIVGPSAAVVVLVLLAGLNVATGTPLRPGWVKGERENPEVLDFVGWNTYSRITASPAIEFFPTFWAQSRNLPPELMAPFEQRTILIDGAAATMMAELGDIERHRYLEYDLTSFAHNLRPEGPAAVIGVGGGRDVLVAKLAGHDPVVGVELNDLIVELHEEVYPEFSGLSSLEGVELVSDEARSHFAREDRRFSVITMSLIDTWASTGAGSYSLSENGLYTVEAWEVFMDRLDDDGIYTVSRWYLPSSPGETARMLALAMEVLYRRGVEDPREHIMLLQNLQVATLLVSPTPFSEKDINDMQTHAVRLGFNMVATPRRPPNNEVLRELWEQPDQDSMWAFCRSQDLDLTPPTDDRPFFFNMLKPSTWLRDPGSVDELDVSFLGNLQATQTLVYATLVSILLTVGAVGVPLFLRRKSLAEAPRAALIASATYFAFIGLGFMFVEIGLLSRLNVFLGHPTLALATLLGGIILFTGIGSRISEHFDITKPTVHRFFPLIPAALVGIAAVLSGVVTSNLAGSGTATRILISVACVGLPALGLGLCFPLGLRLARPVHPEIGPWLWGINGAFGVCASGLALGCSMAFGIPATLGVGAACYLVLVGLTTVLGKHAA